MLLGVFLSTKGRGAFLAGLIALGGWSFLQLRRRRWKLLAVGAVLLAAAAGGAYIHYAGRGFGSMTERVGYWITSASMTAEEPLTGSGWGDFTHHHARGKFMGNTELARDPHNMIASFAAAAGVPGLLYSLLLLGLPLVTAARRFRATDLEGKLLAGGLFAFSLHTLMDLDMQVPGLMALMILTQFLVVTGRTAAEAPAGRSARWAGAVSGVLIALLALTGGLRWNRAEMALDALLNASGQAVGNINTAPAAPARVRQLVKEAAAAAPCSPGPYMAGGNYMLKIGDLRQAERDFLEAQKRAPEYWLIFQRLSEVAARRGDAEQAEKLHREAVNRFPLYFKLKGEDKKP